MAERSPWGLGQAAASPQVAWSRLLGSTGRRSPPPHLSITPSALTPALPAPLPLFLPLLVHLSSPRLISSY